MEFEDLINGDSTSDEESADMLKRLDYLQDDKNLEQLFRFWNSLHKCRLPKNKSDHIYSQIISEINRKEKKEQAHSRYSHSVSVHSKVA